MTDRHHQQLKGLLEQAVPDDAPTLDPHAVAAAARRSRNRSRAAVAGVAALAVVGSGVAWAALDGRGDDSGRVANDGSSAPYDAPACPTTLPDLADAASSVGSLDGLASVRMCPDFEQSSPDSPPLSEQKAILAGMDALVDDLDGFGESVAATELFDPGRCAAMDVFNTRQSLQLAYADGRTVLLPTGACLPITVAGHKTDGQYLGEAFLASLDGQRSTFDYMYDGTVPLSCALSGTGSPARPGRERIVAGKVCGHHDGAERRLTGDEVTALDRAWAEARADDNSCDGGSPPRPAASHVMLATDHGDLLRVEVQPCRRLLWHGSSAGQDPAYLRIDGEDLTP